VSEHDANAQNRGEDNKQEEHDQNEHQEGEGNERVPLLFVDVNLGNGESERIVIHEGDDPQALAHKFVDDHGNY
jgi:hypothetical protein